MKASFFCSAVYGKAGTPLTAPVPPRYCDPAVAQESYQQWLEYAAMADEFGFDWVSTSEHHYAGVVMTPSIGPISGALSQIVRRAQLTLLGPLVTINNPVRVAEEIAMLDHLTGGRLNVLLLRGTPNEFMTYKPIDPEVTQPMTQASYYLIRKALTEPEPFSWQDEFFDFPTVSVWPRPLQQSIPFYYSGNSMESAMFAARERLGLCLSFHPANVTADIVGKYRAEAQRNGWEPTRDHIVYRCFGLVADTNERAAQLAPSLGPPLRENPFWLRQADDPLNGASRAAEPVDTDQAVPYGLGRLLFAGNPDTAAKALRAFQQATGIGIVDVVFSTGQMDAGDVRRSIELFGREVLPQIHEFGASSAVDAVAGKA